MEGIKIFHKDNFLEKDEADKFEEGIKNLPNNWFDYCLLSRGHEFDTKFFNYNEGIEDSEEFKEIEKKCRNSYTDGFFAYKFQRTDRPHHLDCWCKLCDLNKYFRSEEVFRKISEIIGEEVDIINESFISKYKRGDYLTIHHDAKKGDYAFIYQLTKDWNPVYGGLLHFVDNKKVYKTIVPEYNSISIFKIKDTPNTDHFVSEITVDKTRMAYTGWFSVKNVNENKE